MGRGSRHVPVKLAGKLLSIRLALGLSQTELLSRLGVEDFISYQRISEYELGKREPLLIVLLAYARVANISTDILIDDKKNLPAKLSRKAKRSRR
ncbi:MAG TPA: helix-turn-helix transcriptional regulator [Pyrinomonadaceae bacterium]|jgi:transcriptional regulator with XRE-family HTH domain